MADQLIEALKGVGLSEEEARLYLAALKSGEASLSELAHKAQIPRTSAYALTKNLCEKGFLGVFVKRKRRFFVPSPPHKIIASQLEKAETFASLGAGFEALRATPPHVPRLFVFEGKEGVREIFHMILDEKRPFMAITCIEDMQHVAHEYFEEFIRRRIAQRLRIQLLTNRSPASLELKRSDAEALRQTRFVPAEYRFHTASYIFGNKVAILSLKQEPVVGVIIDDPGIAATHRMYFELIWNRASFA